MLYLYDQYAARKGECEGCAPQGAFRSATAAARRHLARRWNLCGFPRSRSVTRPQATTFASAKVPLQKETPSFRMGFLFGAGDEARTRYLDLGKVALYQMSYARRRHHYCGAYGASGRGRTGDTRIFSPLLYQLSYRGKWRPRRGSNPRPPA